MSNAEVILRPILPSRLVGPIACKVVVYREITCAEYRARCDCCKTFRTTLKGGELAWAYDNRVRQAVLGMNEPAVEKTP